MGKQKFCNSYIFFVKFYENFNLGQVNCTVRQEKHDVEPWSLNELLNSDCQVSKYVLYD